MVGGPVPDQKTLTEANVIPENNSAGCSGPPAQQHHEVPLEGGGVGVCRDLLVHGGAVTLEGLWHHPMRYYPRTAPGRAPLPCGL